MNHPTREDWMSYLYDESSAEAQTSLTAHLAACPECAARVASWRGAKQELDGWKLPAHATRESRNPGFLRWAAAAAIIVSLGFVFGRASAPAPAGVEEVRAALEPLIRQQLHQEFAQQLRTELTRSSQETLAAAAAQNRELLEEFAKSNEQQRIDDNRAIYAALNKLDSQRLADYASLKLDLDTVAVFSEAGLRQTQRQLVQLASYTEPAGNLSDSPQN